MLSCNKHYSYKVGKGLNKSSITNLSFLIMISISLFCCSEKMFILMSIWMNGKNLVKHHCLKKTSYSKSNLNNITNSDYMHAIGVCKDFEIKYLGE